MYFYDLLRPPIGRYQPIFNTGTVAALWTPLFDVLINYITGDNQLKHPSIIAATAGEHQSQYLHIPTDAPASLNRAMHYVAANYRGKIYIADVASCACISEPHLSYLFKKFCGQSFCSILNQVRISKAEHLLLEKPGRQVTQICADVGFSDLSHFAKTFKKMVGISPGRYRKQQLRASSAKATINNFVEIV